MSKTWQRLAIDLSFRQRLQKRARIIRAVREFFWKEGFFEAETPLLTPTAIPASYLTMFETTLVSRRGKSVPLYLATSPEASLKKLLASGIGNCFEITRSFRNGETESTTHNPEFTILEWYRTGVSYETIMDDCERLFLSVFCTISPSFGTLLTYQGRTMDLRTPWQRISVSDALKRYSGVSLDDIIPSGKSRYPDIFPVAWITPAAKKKGYAVDEKTTWEQLFNQILLNDVEPALKALGKPVILYDFPKPLAALSRMKKNDPRLSERFEVYAGGLEIANCFSELTDAGEQRKRFASEAAVLKQTGRPPIRPDTDFLDALSQGLPECAGIALGIDRLVMLLTDAKTIQDVLFFPMENMIQSEKSQKEKVKIQKHK